jgi:putative SOS response-associated peptidase YedK
MCGRYVITSAPEAIRALFRYSEQPNFPARYNVAPTQPVPIVRIQEGVRGFALVRWGLIPSWVKDPRGFTLLINARGETVLDKPAFRNAMRRRRCLFPADGFYEWKADGGRKRPYFIHPRQGGPIAFAGLWETWIGPNGEEVETACIVTTAANRMLAPIHDRMPVVIAPEAFDLWLDSAEAEVATAAALIAPAPESLFEAVEVSAAGNRTANDGPSLIEPLPPDTQATAPAASAAPAAADPAAKPVTQPGTKPAGKAKRTKNDGQASLL